MWQPPVLKTRRILTVLNDRLVSPEGLKRVAVIDYFLEIDWKLAVSSRFGWLHSGSGGQQCHDDDDDDYNTNYIHSIIIIIIISMMTMMIIKFLIHCLSSGGGFGWYYRLEGLWWRNGPKAPKLAGRSPRLYFHHLYLCVFHATSIEVEVVEEREEKSEWIRIEGRNSLIRQHRLITRSDAFMHWQRWPLLTRSFVASWLILLRERVCV